MATEIKVWQIDDGNLKIITSSMTDAGRKEKEHLEQWIKSNPIILGENISVIGEQVQTASGEMDFLCIDRAGNIIIVELKRDRLKREVLAQAIDYASAVADWDVDKISEECLRFTGEKIEDHLSEAFKELDIENFVIGKEQRILIVGFSVDESLQRMVEWLSNEYGVTINIIILKYVQTPNGEELLARTMIIPEEVEKARANKRKIASYWSEKIGTYDVEELKKKLKEYLSENRITPKRIKNILLPLCLKHAVVTREMIKKLLVDQGEATDDGKAGTILTTISREITISGRDYLRQVIEYEKINSSEKDNYKLVTEYKDIVKELLEALTLESKGEE